MVTQTDQASISLLASYGADSIRTYTAVGGPAILAEALAAGVTVNMGIAIPPAAGNSALYTSASARAALIASIQPLVQACISYPSLLMWEIGNEVEDPPNQGYGPIFSFMDQLATDAFVRLCTFAPAR